MRTIEIEEVTAVLVDYAKGVGDEPLVVTHQGKPIAALLPTGDADLETITLSLDPEFLAIIEQSRIRQAVEGGLSTDEVRDLLGLKKPAKQPRVKPGEKSAV